MNSEDTAYLAGLFDGEGCICISRRPTRHARETGTRRFTHVLSVSIVNTNLAVLEWAKDTIGCGGSLQVKGKPKPHHMTVYNLRWTSKAAGQVLSILYPYLRIKKQQASRALEFQATFQDGKRPGRGYNSDVILEKRDMFLSEVKRLKKVA